MALAVTRLERTTGWDSAWQAADGYEFVVLEIALENLGLDDAPVNLLSFQLIDSRGLHYFVAAAAPAPELESGYVLRGLTARGNIAFEVPLGASGLILVYQPSALPGGAAPVILPLGP